MSDAGFVFDIKPEVDAAAASTARNVLRDALGAARFADDFRRAGRAAGDAGREARKGFRGSREDMDALLKDARALETVLKAQARRKVKFIDPDEFALVNRAIQKVQQFQRELVKAGQGGANKDSRLRLRSLEVEATKASQLLRASVQDQVRAGEAAERAKTQAAAQGARERLVIAQKEASQERFVAQRVEQEKLSASQRSNQIRAASARFFLDSILRLERGVGTAITGIARGSASAVGRIYSDTFGRVSALFTRNKQTLEHIERSSSLSRLNIFRSSMSQQERILSQSLSRQQVLIQRSQQKAQTGVIGASRRSSLLGLGGGLAGLGVLSLGLERFSNIERLNRQFLALTGNAETATSIMQQVADFARKTPFDLIGVADLAKGFLAIKTPAEQVLPRIKAIADAVALTGGGVAELGRIQKAIGQIVSIGKLQGDELNQLSESLPGLSVTQILADQLTGGNTQLLLEMKEAGELSADAVINGLVTGLAQDPRLAGASEDLAKTLGGRLANLKEVVADTGAAFIGLIAEPMKRGTELATIALDGLSQFIRGNVTGALALLRTAAGGAAVAIGGLLVAKAAAEALQLLAGAARLVLTPFGALIVAVGAIGAAFAVMRTRSEEFRDVTDRLGKLLGTQFRNVVTAVGGAVDTVRAAFTKAHAPITQTADALERAAKPARTWISEIGTKLGSAIGTASRFLTGTLIPALARVAIFIGQRIGPAFRFLGDVLRQFGTLAAPVVEAAARRIDAALDAIGRRVGEVRDTLESAFKGPATAGLAIALSGPATFLTGMIRLVKTLKSELLTIGGAALGGTLIAGPLGGLVAGIAASFATLSPTIRNAIVDGAQQARDRVVRTFRGINWSGLAQGALRFVNRVGRILGQIVSDRRFLTALAGIAAAAGAVAVNFVTGFVSGVASNLGDIVAVGNLIANTIIEGITSAFSNPKNIGIAAALGAALFAGRGIFRLGQTVAGEFDKGMKAGFLNTTRRGGSLLAGLFGGPGALEADARRTAVRAQKALDTEFRRLNSTIRATGSIGIAKGGAFVTQQEVDAAKARVKQLNGVLGETGVAAAGLRGAFQSAFSTVQTGGLRNVFSNVKAGFGDIAAALKGQGAAIGSALGVGIAGGLASAVGGQQLGAGNTVGGLGTIIASSLLTGLAIGGPAGIAVGGVVGVIGLITAAFTASGTAAKKAAGEVKFYSESLVDAARAGNPLRQTLIDDLFTQIQKEQPATRKAFADLGITVEDFADIASLGTTEFDKFLNATKAMDQIGGRGEVLAATFRNAQNVISKIGDPTTRATLQALFDAFKSGAIDSDTFKEAVDALRDETGEAAAGFREMESDLSILGHTAEGAANPFANLGTKISGVAAAMVELANVKVGNIAAIASGGINTVLDTVKGKLNDAQTAAEAAKTAVDKLLNPSAGTFGSAIDNLLLTLPGIAANITGLNIGSAFDVATLNTNLETLRGNIADTIKTGIDDGLNEAEVDGRLEDVKTAISTLDIDDSVKAAMIAEIQKAIDIQAIPIANFDVDTGAASAAGEAAGTAALGGFTSVSTGSAGNSFATGIAAGIRAKVADMQAAARAVANAALASVNAVFQIASPSKVGIDIGQNFGNAMAQGITDSAAAIAFAAQEAAQAATSTANEVLSKKKDLFASAFAGDSALDAAKINVNQGLGSLLSAAQQEGSTRSIALDLGGIENRGLFAAAVDNIKDLGAEMLDAGKSASEIAEAMLRTRQDLLNFAGMLGFSTAEIDALITELGLGTDAITRFATDVGKVQPDLKDPSKSDTTGTTEPTIGTVNVNLALPFADPEAVSLSVANRIATTVRR